MGEVLKSGMTGQIVYYSAYWEEIYRKARQIARKQHLFEPNDVRLANVALDMLGIPNCHSEADQDDKGNWIIYWR